MGRLERPDWQAVFPVLQAEPDLVELRCSNCSGGISDGFSNRVFDDPATAGTRWLTAGCGMQRPMTGVRTAMSTTGYQKNRLIELVREWALTFGDFRLASGQQASFYLDCRKLTLCGEGANQVGSGMLDLLERTGMPELVGGMAIGADPITAAIVTLGWQRGHQLRGFMVRKEAKSHGTGKMVEGPIRPGDRAVIVEDVVTTGGSSLRAIELAREAGLEIDRCLTIIDRQQGGAEKFAAVGVQLHSLLKLDELGIG